MKPSEHIAAACDELDQIEQRARSAVESQARATVAIAHALIAIAMVVDNPDAP